MIWHDPANALAELLNALSRIDKLAPLEGRQRDKRGDAYVVFQYGASNQELRQFVERMLPRLHEQAPEVTFVIDLEWVGGNELLAVLNVPVEGAGALASAIAATAADTEGARH